MPRKRALSNFEIERFCKGLPGFRGVFCKDEFPPRPWRIECGVVNLSPHNQPGTHWTAYKIRNNVAIWFDSFGALRPPTEFVKYCRNRRIFFNHDSFQTGETTNCGQHCVRFLRRETLTGMYNVLR